MRSERGRFQALSGASGPPTFARENANEWPRRRANAPGPHGRTHSGLWIEPRRAGRFKLMLAAHSSANSPGVEVSLLAGGGDPGDDKGRNAVTLAREMTMGAHTRTRVGVIVGYGVLSGIWIYAAKRGRIPSRRFSGERDRLGARLGRRIRCSPGLDVAQSGWPPSGSGLLGSDWLCWFRRLSREPLLSPPGILVFMGIGMALLLGRALGEGWDWLRAGARARRPSSLGGRDEETPIRRGWESGSAGSM